MFWMIYISCMTWVDYRFFFAPIFKPHSWICPGPDITARGWMESNKRQNNGCAAIFGQDLPVQITLAFSEYSLIWFEQNGHISKSKNIGLHDSFCTWRALDMSAPLMPVPFLFMNKPLMHFESESRSGLCDIYQRLFTWQFLCAF